MKSSYVLISPKILSPLTQLLSSCDNVLGRSHGLWRRSNKSYSLNDRYGSYIFINLYILTFAIWYPFPSYWIPKWTQQNLLTVLTPLIPENFPSPSRHNLGKHLPLIIRSILQTFLSSPFINTSNKSGINLPIHVIEKICCSAISCVPPLALWWFIPMSRCQSRSQSHKIRNSWNQTCYNLRWYLQSIHRAYPNNSIAMNESIHVP